MQKFMAVFFLILLSCSTAPKDSFGEAAPTVSQATLTKEPKTEVVILESNIPKGLQELKDRKIAAYFIYNLPDSFLIRAKNLFNPPDYAAQEVMNLERD